VDIENTNDNIVDTHVKKSEIISGIEQNSKNVAICILRKH